MIVTQPYNKTSAFAQLLATEIGLYHSLYINDNALSFSGWRSGAIPHEKGSGLIPLIALTQPVIEWIVKSRSNQAGTYFILNDEVSFTSNNYLLTRPRTEFIAEAMAQDMNVIRLTAMLDHLPLTFIETYRLARLPGYTPQSKTDTMCNQMIYNILSPRFDRPDRKVRTRKIKINEADVNVEYLTTLTALTPHHYKTYFPDDISARDPNQSKADPYIEGAGYTTITEFRALLEQHPDVFRISHDQASLGYQHLIIGIAPKNTHIMTFWPDLNVYVQAGLQIGGFYAKDLNFGIGDYDWFAVRFWRQHGTR